MILHADEEQLAWTIQ